jgi:hypothetical protein
MKLFLGNLNKNDEINHTECCFSYLLYDELGLF